MSGQRASKGIELPSSTSGHSLPSQSIQATSFRRGRRPTRDDEGLGGQLRRKNWTKKEDELLLSIVRDVQLTKAGMTGFFSTDEWNQMTDMYNARNHDGKVDKAMLQGRLKTLKKLFSLYQMIREKSGWGWDHDRSIPVPPDAHAWDKLIEHNKDYKKIRNKSFPQFYDMENLFGRNVARGHHLVTTTTVGGGQGSSVSGDNDEQGDDMIRIADDEAYPRGSRQISGSHAPHNDEQGDDMIPIANDKAYPHGSQQISGAHAPQPESAPVRGRGSSRGGVGMGGSSSGLKRRRTDTCSSSMDMYELEERRVALMETYIKHLREKVTSKDELAACMEKITAVAGDFNGYVVAGMRACRKKENKYLVELFSPGQLLEWLHHQWEEQQDKCKRPPQVQMQEASPGPAADS